MAVPSAARPWAIWMMQPGLAVTTAWAPVARTLATLRAWRRCAISGWVRLYVPAEPQHQSASASGTTVSPGTWARRARGSRLIFWPCTM